MKSIRVTSIAVIVLLVCTLLCAIPSSVRGDEFVPEFVQDPSDAAAAATRTPPAAQASATKPAPPVATPVATPTPTSTPAAATKSSDESRFRVTDLVPSSMVADLMKNTDVPACRPASTDNREVLQTKCQTIGSRDSKTYLAAAFTECHIATASHAHIHSCRDKMDNPAALETCVKDMNRDPMVFNIFTQFYNSVDSICGEIDRDFLRRRSHEALDAMVSVTLNTATALEKLQSGTEVLSAEIQSNLKQNGQQVLTLLQQHSTVESERFEQLSLAATNIEQQQLGIFNQINDQTSQLKSLLTDSESIQLLINEASVKIQSTQSEIVNLQLSTNHGLSETNAHVLQMKLTQKEQYEKALENFKTLQDLNTHLAEAQKMSINSLYALNAQQTASFEVANAHLATLSDEQKKGFQAQQDQLQQVQSAQQLLRNEQDHLHESIKQSSQQLNTLQAAQKEGFFDANVQLNRIFAQAGDIESKLSSTLDQIRNITLEIMNINFDMLKELFHIHSGLFYLFLLPFIYIATSLEKTKSARFYIVSLVIASLLLELNLATAAHKFEFHLSSHDMDIVREKLRFGVAALSGLILVLSVLLYKDYAALNYSLHMRASKVIDNNHRMLHELIRRTEMLSPESKKASASAGAASGKKNQKNSTYENPAGEGQTAEGSSGDASKDDDAWRHVDVFGKEACCPDHRPAPSLAARLFCADSSSSSASSKKTAAQPFIDASLLESPKHTSTNDDDDDEYDRRSRSPSPEGDRYASRTTRSRSRSASAFDFGSSTATKPSHRRAKTSVVDEEGEEGAAAADTEPGNIDGRARRKSGTTKKTSKK